MEPIVIAEKIGGRDLFIGNARAAHPNTTELEFDEILSVDAQPHPETTTHSPIIDGKDATREAFVKAVEKALSLRRKPGVLLINCNVGISRSAAVIATVIAIEDDVSFEAGLAEVREVRSKASPNPVLREYAQQYVAEN